MTTSDEQRVEWVPEELDHPAFHEAWFDWLASRKELKKPATERAQKMAMRKLAAMGLAGAVWSLGKSCIAGWTDIYPPKDRDLEEVNALREQLESEDELALGDEDTPHDPFLDGLPRGDGRVWSSYYGELVDEDEWMPMDDMIRIHGSWNLGAVTKCAFIE